MLNVVFGVGASERLEPRGVTDDGAVQVVRPFFSSEAHSRLAVDVEVLRLADLVVPARRHRPGGAHRQGRRIVRVVIACLDLARDAGIEHKLAKVGQRDVATCGGYNSQL